MADIAPVNMTIDMTGGEPAADEHLVADVADDVVVIAEEGDEVDPLPANAVLQPDGSVILTLRFPVALKWKREGSDDVRIEERRTLHMRRLTGGDMRAVMAAGQGHAVPTGIAKSCRMQQGVFNKLFDMMDGADAGAAAQVFSFFLDAGAPTPSGPPSSP